MGNVFYGWPRKVGVVTLMMACVLMAGWVRSPSLQDILRFPTGTHSSIQVTSACSLVMFITIQSESVDERLTNLDLICFPVDKRGRILRFASNFDFAGTNDVPLKAFHMNRGIRTFASNNFTWQSYQVPYWFIVIPLTLLSAYLLLSKPRKSTQGKITEPVPEKAV